MTYPQQPQYGQPQYPQAQPQYAPPAPQPQTQQFPPQQQQWPAPQPQVQQFQQFQQPQAPAQPQAPVIRGTLADAYSQGVRTGGYGNTAKFLFPGYQLGGYVARDLADTDVTAETDFATKQPKPDGRGGYRMQITIPLDVQPSQEHSDGKTTVWAKGRLLTAVIHGMMAVGYDINAGDSLKKGDFLLITRTADVPTNKGNPAHDFEAVVTRAGQASQFPPTAPAATATPTAAPVAASLYPTAPPAAPVVNAINGFPPQAPQYAQPQQPVFEQPAFQAPAPVAAPASGTPGLVPGSYQDILVRSLTGNNGQGPLSPEEQAILNAGPPQQ